MTTMTQDRPPTELNREPGRARALFSTADFRLLRAALASHARVTDDRDDLARINALHHRLGTYVSTE